MRKRVLYFLLLAIPLLSASKKSDTVRSQLKDLTVFKTAFLQKEGTVDLHIDKSTLNAAFDELEAQLNYPQSLLQQFKAYSRFLSQIQCGHTQIHPNKEVFREWLSARKALPIDVYLIGKHLVVNKLSELDHAYAPNAKERKRFEHAATIPAGSEILSIGGKSVPEMIATMSPYLSSDENGVDFKYFQAKELFEFYRHLSAPFVQDSLLLIYIDKRDTLQTYLQTGQAPVRTINERLKKSAQLFEESEQDMGKFAVQGKYGYFRFRSFKSCFGSKYESFLHDSFDELQRKKIKKLIIDLRGNTGGAMQYEFMRYITGEDVDLGKYVVSKPKRPIENSHFVKISPDFIKHIRASRVQKRLQRKGKFDNGLIKTEEIDPDIVYHGEIVVITDEGTFSSAAILACHLKTLANAHIIGRNSGGSFYAGNAGTITLKLPHSKLKILVNPNTFYSQLNPVNNPIEIKVPDRIEDPLIIGWKNREAYYYKVAKSSFK